MYNHKINSILGKFRKLVKTTKLQRILTNKPKKEKDICVQSGTSELGLILNSIMFSIIL